jgi:putative sugar O-methyltransferase
MLKKSNGQRVVHIIFRIEYSEAVWHRKMIDKEENLKKIVKKMMKDSYLQDELYTAGNYWKFYEKNILKQINKNALSRFRSWEGGAGVGNIQSFSGGAEFKSRFYGRNFHPLDDAFSFIDDSYLVRKYNGLINKIIPYIPIFKYFLIRIAELKRYHKGIYNLRIVDKYNFIKNLDESLTEISDSSFGIDKKNIVSIDEKIYTNAFLDCLIEIYYIKKNTEFESINHIVELGAGIGLLASAFLKLNKKIKYLIVDIPPTIFFSQYYLSNIGYKVFDYNKIAEEETIDVNKIFESYDVICLPSWKLTKLKDFNFDLFINSGSFQEIERKQTLNYLNVLKKRLNKYIYLDNGVYGHEKADKKGKFGVLEPTTLVDMEDCLHDKYTTINKYFYGDDNLRSNKRFRSIYKNKSS